MATDPKINLNVTTSDAVKNLSTLEGAAIDSDTAIEKIDGSSVSVDTSATQKALQEVADKLDKVDKNADNAGKKGIPVSTNAFKDLTEGIGGPASGAIGSMFGFGETIEGIGDILEGFGGKLGLSEAQVGNLTSKLGTGLAVLGGLGAALTVGIAAYEGFQSLTGQAAKKQKEFNDDVKEAQTELKGLSDLLADNKKEEAYRKILELMTDDLGLLGEAGVNVADVIKEVAESNKDAADGYRKEADGLNKLGAELEADAEARLARGEITEAEYDQVLLQVDAYDLQASKLREVADQVAIWVEAGLLEAETANIIREALGELNTTTAENEQANLDAAEAVLDLIDANREYERTLDDTQTALEEYSQAIKDAKGDTEKIDDAARDAADSVITMAQDFGKLEGAAVGTEEWQARTTAALGYVAATLGPDDPLRKRLLDYKAELDSIPAVKTTAITANLSDVPNRPPGVPNDPNFYNRANTTINVTVTSADPQAVVKALQSYVRQNGSLPANLR
jgi:hypothetical protein